MRCLILLFFIPALLFSQTKKQIIASHEQTIKRLNLILQEKEEILQEKEEAINFERRKKKKALREKEEVLSEKSELKSELTIKEGEVEDLIVEINEGNKLVDSLLNNIDSLSKYVEFIKQQTLTSFRLSVLDSIYDGNYIIANQTFSLQLAGLYYGFGAGLKAYIPIEKLDVTKIDGLVVPQGYSLLDLEKGQIRTTTKGSGLSRCRIGWGPNCENNYEEKICNERDRLNCVRGHFFNNSSVSVSFLNLSSNIAFSDVISPVKIEFTKSKFASLINDSSVSDYMFEIKTKNNSDGFGNDVISFDFTKDGETELSIPLVVHNNKCYLALALNDVVNYFYMNFPPMLYFENSDYYYDDDFSKKWANKDLYYFDAYNAKSELKTTLLPGDGDIFLFELIENK